jgi:hypothetical protein
MNDLEEDMKNQICNIGVWNARAGSLQINLAHIWDSFDRMNRRTDRGYDSKNCKDKIIDCEGQN